MNFTTLQTRITDLPESPPVISITGTTKKATEPTARNAAAQKVSTARIVTPVGRFTALTFPHVLRVVQSRVTPLLRLPGKRCDRSVLSSKETPCLVRRFIYSVTYFLSRFVCGTVELVQHSIEIPSGESPLERFGDGFVMSLECEQTFC